MNWLYPEQCLLYFFYRLCLITFLLSIYLSHHLLNTKLFYKEDHIFFFKFIYQFLSSVQFSCSVVSDSLRPHESQHARPPCPSPSPGVHSDSRPSSPWCHPAISYLGRSLLLLPLISPSIRVFSNESTLRMRWPKYWSFITVLVGIKDHSFLFIDFSDGHAAANIAPYVKSQIQTPLRLHFLFLFYWSLLNACYLTLPGLLLTLKFIISFFFVSNSLFQI